MLLLLTLILCELVLGLNLHLTQNGCIGTAKCSLSLVIYRFAVVFFPRDNVFFSSLLTFFWLLVNEEMRKIRINNTQKKIEAIEEESKLIGDDSKQSKNKKRFVRFCCWHRARIDVFCAWVFVTKLRKYSTIVRVCVVFAPLIMCAYVCANSSSGVQTPCKRACM